MSRRFTWVRWLSRAAPATSALLFACATVAHAQSGTSNTSPAPGACWRVQFAGWEPALDWNRAGHARNALGVDSALRHVRDSVFDRDTVATRSNAMVWESGARGWSLMLYPPWWPAGVSITFDGATKGSSDLTGDAVALVADATRRVSRTRAHVWQVPCG